MAKKEDECYQSGVRKLGGQNCVIIGKSISSVWLGLVFQGNIKLPYERGV